jgi:hypothetical protein
MRNSGEWFSGDYISPKKKLKNYKGSGKEKSPFIYEIQQMNPSPILP